MSISDATPAIAIITFVAGLTLGTIIEHFNARRDHHR